ncbi:MAG TPA: zinc ribbon domain-containing protein [Tepidisphaeraceae bacterium]|jgi:hypothetical protein|nr:zinc ribbon domain-containing protein [Tepidisphaeraceae bacterium]
MDLSKLPRLSKTETPAPPPSQSPSPQPLAGPATIGPACPYCAAPLRAGAKFCDKCGAALRATPQGSSGVPATGAEAWISIGLGILLIFLNPTLTKYVSSKLLHTSFAPYADLKDDPSDSVHFFKTDDMGNRVLTEVRPYLKTNGDNEPNFPNDLAITSFALALILEGIALVLSRRPIVVVFALVVTIAATLYNLIFFVNTYAHYKTIPIISALAVLFGGYMAVYQFSLFKSRVPNPRKFRD